MIVSTPASASNVSTPLPLGWCERYRNAGGFAQQLIGLKNVYAEHVGRLEIDQIKTIIKCECECTQVSKIISIKNDDT